MNLRSALMSSQGEILPFFQRPFSATFLGLALAYVAVVTLLRLRKRAAQRRAGAAAASSTESR